ncbi:MAG: DNA polymerase Y family protein [Planctomycetota bacterium]|jgi:DNA polymerase-4
MEHEDKLILHVDVDAFFASVEQLLIPSLRSRPVIVGSGCIASCSYEARRFGLKADMPLRKAKRLCPQVVILAGQYQIYRCFAEHVWQVCRRYTCGLETYLDEAYGDATGMTRIHGEPPRLGRKLQREVREQVGLGVSVGLAENRMLAKLASSSAKPGGVAWVRPGEAMDVLTPLPIEKLLGVGQAVAEKLRDMNIRTVGELRALPVDILRSMFGRRGEVLYERCRGRDVENCPDLKPRTPKTISRETTFHKPTCEVKQIRGMLFYLLERAMRTARLAGLVAHTVELTIRYDDWKALAASQALPQATADDKTAYAAILKLFERLHRRRVALRHVGIVLSHFSPAGGEANLFEPQEAARRRNLLKSVDMIRTRYGHAAVVTGKSIELLGRLEQNDYGFVLRTPSLTK